jgi:hypothetical protein
LVTAPALAWAQAPVPSFDQVLTRVKVGDTVFVTDATGREVKGKVVDLSASSLALRSGSERQEFPAAQVRARTWQKPDSLVNGLLIGLCVGAGVGFVMGWGIAEDDANEALVGTVFGLVGAGIGVGAGVGIDALIPGKKILVYRAPSSPSAARISIAPILLPTRQGVAVRVVF